MCWNVNGWGANKHEGLAGAISFYEPSLALVSETWFLNAKTIPQVEGYEFLTRNCAELHRRARVGSGGIGLLVSEQLLKHYKMVEFVDKYDSILALSLKHKKCDFSIGFIIGYLPPQHTKYGNDPDLFFECMTQLIYMFNDLDCVIIGGDYNARTGNMQDYIADIDEISERQSVDPVTNKHGDCFMEFLRDVQFAIVNGRITNVIHCGTTFMRN